jgi:hypothetical protein
MWLCHSGSSTVLVVTTGNGIATALLAIHCNPRQQNTYKNQGQARSS